MDGGLQESASLVAASRLIDQRGNKNIAFRRHCRTMQIRVSVSSMSGCIAIASNAAEGGIRSTIDLVCQPYSYSRGFSCFAAARHACFFLSVSSIPSGTCRCVKYRTESREYDDEGWDIVLKWMLFIIVLISSAA